MSNSALQTFAGLNRTKVLTGDGTISQEWQRGLNALALAVNSPATSGNIPTSSNFLGTAGQIATDGAFVYVCIATNKWARVALSAF